MKIHITTTKTQTYNLHSDIASEKFKEHELYDVDNLDVDTLKEMGLYLTGTHHDVKIKMEENEQ